MALNMWLNNWMAWFVFLPLFPLHGLRALLFSCDIKKSFFLLFFLYFRWLERNPWIVLHIWNFWENHFLSLGKGSPNMKVNRFFYVYFPSITLLLINSRCCFITYAMEQRSRKVRQILTVGVVDKFFVVIIVAYLIYRALTYFDPPLTHFDPSTILHKDFNHIR